MVAGCTRDVLVTGALDTYEERRLVAQQFASGVATSVLRRQSPSGITTIAARYQISRKEGGVSWDCLGDFLIVTGLVRMMKCACE